MNILVTMPRGKTRDAFIPPDVAGKLKELGTVTWNEGTENWSGMELSERLRGIDVCVTGWGNAFIDGGVLAGADRLRLVAHTGGTVAPLVGEDFFDRGLTVVSGNQLYAESVAEGVIAYILCALRKLPHYTNELQSGRWSEPDSVYEGLLGQTVGLVGFGMVARHLVRMLEPFRARISVYDPYVSDEVLASCGVRRASLEEVLTGSKIISLHTPRTPDTYHMISAELLRAIPDGALLVNTARGSVIDEEALASELATGRFQAVLDVFESEPLPPDSKLRMLENVIMIPHMAGPTFDRRRLVTLALIDEIRNFFEGRPLTLQISRQYALSMTR